MGLIKIKKGLNVPINGKPEQVIEDGVSPGTAALVGFDYAGMKPTLEVAVGDKVKRGQLLFTDKKMAGVKFTSPAGGTVAAINRGEKRVFQSLVIEIAENEEEETFESYPEIELTGLDTDKIKTNLVESGLWTALRARPFGKVANPAGTPNSIFVTAMDTNPLAPSIEKILEGKENQFKNGLTILSRLTPGTVYLCKSPGAKIPSGNIVNLSEEEFAGPHPAGLPGTHIHFLDPVYSEKTVWHIDAQDVAAVGELFLNGRLPVDRVISLGGPSVKNPRLIRTRLGASIDDLVADQLTVAENRVITGSVLSGRTAIGPLAYLGRYHQSVCALEEGRKRTFLGWLSPGFNLFSVKPILASALSRGKKFNFTTDTNGGVRSIVPIGSYEKIMPLDFEVSYLLRAIMANDIENAEQLGFLELVEEDLALCSYVSPSKIDYAAALRHNLTVYEKEG